MIIYRDGKHLEYVVEDCNELLKKEFLKLLGELNLEYRELGSGMTGWEFWSQTNKNKSSLEIVSVEELPSTSFKIRYGFSFLGKERGDVFTLWCPLNKWEWKEQEKIKALYSTL